MVRLSRRCSDPRLVDEAVQDTFVAIWKRPQAYRGRGDVAAWIWGIGVRRLIDLLRHRRDALLHDAQIGEQALGVVESAEEEVLAGIEYGRLGDALEGLSPELRAVVQATILDGLTTREAGRLLGIPQGTVKTRMKRAREVMREALA
jgi:RNA polymerase sigma-70 factor (ECF subfamily)